MKTVKLNIINDVDILKDMKTFNSIIHLAYNRFKDDLEEKTVRSKLNTMFKDENCWFIQCAIKEGKTLYSRFAGQKVVFGGKFNLKQYLTKKISKEQYSYNRLSPISIQGEQAQKGNRLFKFDFENNEIIFKKNKKDHKIIKFNPVKKNLKNELKTVQELCDQNKIAVSVRFNDKNIWISYDEKLVHKEKFSNLKENRILGIDMNPNYIGLSIIEFKKNNDFSVLYKQVFDLSLLTKKSGKSSKNKKSKCIVNKLKHETIQIAHEISKLVDYWKCRTVSIEELKIESSDKQQGKHFNRLCNNAWERNLFSTKLKMLANINGFTITEVKPIYSSIVGNIAYGNENTPDMIASSIEIARRAYKKYEKGWFYPKFKIQFQNEQWKQTFGTAENWKELFSQIKKSGVKYRFLLVDYINNAVFSKSYIKPKIKIYKFL